MLSFISEKSSMVSVLSNGAKSEAISVSSVIIKSFILCIFTSRDTQIEVKSGRCIDD